MKTKECAAKIIRCLSVPPLMASVLILILACHTNDIFRNVTEIVIMLVLLGLVPVLAYVLSNIIPAVKEQGREGWHLLRILQDIALLYAGLL